MTRFNTISAITWISGGLALTALGARAAMDDIIFSGEIKDACGATYGAVETMNEALRPVCKDIVGTDYFRYYKVDLSDAMCPFVDSDSGMCGNRACAIDPVDDESEIPEFWRTQYLGKLAQNSFSSDPKWPRGDDNPVSSCLSTEPHAGKYPDSQLEVLNPEDRDTNYCYPEDESRNSPGVYVSLPDNPERFTGYGGAHAHKVWRAVYQENCFGYFGDADDRGHSDAKSGRQLSSVLQEENKYEMQEVGGEAGRLAMVQPTEQCMEQRLFYRLLSGMQSSISTHLCYEYLNKSTGEWKPNLTCFMKRVGNYPERISNLYFNYALVSRAVSKLHNYIDDLYFCRDDAATDNNTRDKLLDLSELATSPKGMPVFNESLVFASREGQALKGEFRKRVRNVNALMSCVGCDRCRLWGKLQTAGYGTALKLLFELPEKPSANPELSEKVLSNFRRSELVALINTFDRLSKSIEAITYFREELSAEKLKNGAQNGTDQWDPEFTAAWEGVKFILRSYVEFPKNLWHLLLSFAASGWDKFIARPQTLRPGAVRLDL